MDTRNIHGCIVLRYRAYYGLAWTHPSPLVSLAQGQLRGTSSCTNGGEKWTSCLARSNMNRSVLGEPESLSLDEVVYPGTSYIAV